jgi:hypothetical protein
MRIIVIITFRSHDNVTHSRTKFSKKRFGKKLAFLKRERAVGPTCTDKNFLEEKGYNHTSNAKKAQKSGRRRIIGGRGMERVSNKWMATVAGIWIESSCGLYTFTIYSSVLKSSQGYDQSTLDTVSVFKDIGGNVGILAGVLYSSVTFRNRSHGHRSSFGGPSAMGGPPGGGDPAELRWLLSNMGFRRGVNPSAPRAVDVLLHLLDGSWSGFLYHSQHRFWRAELHLLSGDHCGHHEGIFSLSPIIL